MKFPAPVAQQGSLGHRLSERVLVYSFNTKSEVWWQQAGRSIAMLPVGVYRLPWESIQRLAAMIERTMQMSVTIADSSLFVATEQGEVEVELLKLSE